MAGDTPCPPAPDGAVPAQCPRTPADGFLVRYGSPSQGEITFGWAPKADDASLDTLTVDGDEVDLHPDDQARWDSPWATSAWDSQRYRAEAGGASIELDFTTATRTATAG